MIVVFSIKYRRILVAFSIIRAIDNRSLTTSLQTISFWIITNDHQPYRFFTGSVRADGCRWSCNSAQFSRLLWSLGWEHVLALHRTYNNGSSPVHLCSLIIFMLLLLSQYALFLFLILGAEIASTVVLGMYKEKLNSCLECSMQQQVRYTYNNTDLPHLKKDNRTRLITEAWDVMQKEVCDFVLEQSFNTYGNHYT